MTYTSRHGITIEIDKIGRKWAYIRKYAAGEQYFHGKVPAAVARQLLAHCESHQWEKGASNATEG